MNSYHIVSYYSANEPWNMFSTWNPTAIQSDYNKLRMLGTTAVRIFIAPSEFGYPTPASAKLSLLQQAIGFARTQGMKTYLNLFDRFSSFADLMGSRTWAKAIVDPYAGSPDIAAFEVFNELNGADLAQSTWARTMLSYVRSRSGGIKVGISPTADSGVGSIQKLKDALGPLNQPDFYSYHYYTSAQEAQERAASIFADAKARVAPVQMIVGESGYSTWNAQQPPASASSPDKETEQATFVEAVQSAATGLSLGTVGMWTLNDFAPEAIAQSERFFGLVRVDGSEKPAAAVVRGFFQ